MSLSQYSADPYVRTIFVSDLHLGCRYADARGFLQFLESCHAESIYLVGDIIDGWRLRRCWHWQPIYNQIVRRLIELAESGTRIYYTPGNHDEFLRHFLRDFGLIHVADEFVHCGPHGQRYLVTHGDKFDAVETKARWLSLLGASGYDALVWLNQWINRLRRRWGLAPWAMSTAVKGRVKQAVKFVSDFEQVLTQRARERQCDGVICGHIHTPVLEQRDDILYCNTGDWVENSTAVIEHWNGKLELLYHPHLCQSWEHAHGSDLLQHVG